MVYLMPERYKLLDELPIPAIDEVQLSAFTMQSIHANKIGSLGSQIEEGVDVLAVDIGGDSVTTAVMSFKNKKLKLISTVVDMHNVKEGTGFLQALEQSARFAKANRLQVGISCAGPLEGTRLPRSVNIPVFIEELASKYGSDFANLFPSLRTVENDAISGLRAGVLEAHSNPAVKDVVYAINGSGLNISAMHNGYAWATEAGHVPVTPTLNPYGQNKPCGLFGDFVCVERVAGNKTGIEDMWLSRTGERLNGIAIEKQYFEGNQFAAGLYDNSATVFAHMVIGGVRALGIDLGSGATALVGHGGAFKFPSYGIRVQQIIESYTGTELPLYMTKDFSSNACLDGAALAALAS